MGNRIGDKKSGLWSSGLVLEVAVAAPTAGQGRPGTTHTGAQQTSRVIRTSDGRPDLQGVWNFSSLTPLERPSEFAGKEFVTGAEAVAFQKLLHTNADITAATDSMCTVCSSGTSPPTFWST